MRKQSRIYIGDVIGYWTVVGMYVEVQKGRKWLCRCTCGTERYVLERSLVYRHSHSCGCQRANRGPEEADVTYIGRRFGDLTVIGRSEVRDRRYSVRWKCECVCGNIVEVTQRQLENGRQTSCGCKEKHVYHDITGQCFGRLTALFPLKERDLRGSKLWHCRCECGNELDIPYNTILYSNTRSCGCKKREHDQVLNELLSRVDGTCINHLQSKKIPANNTTGVRGVFKDKRGKYVARIALQKKQYWLGAYPTLAEAAETRKEAEETINDQVVAFYEKWRTIAEENPAWAEQNPIQIRVERHDGRLRVSITPEI